MYSRYQLRWDCSDNRNSWSETVLAETSSERAIFAAANLLFGLNIMPKQARLVKLDENGYGWRELKLPKEADQ